MFIFSPKPLLLALIISASFFSGVPQALATLDLEVPLEMVDYGLDQPITGSITTYARTAMYMNKADYEDSNNQNDSATYYFEIVADCYEYYNHDIPVYLRDVTNGSDVALSTITVPHNTTSPKRFRSAAWTPADGKIEYRVKIDGTMVGYMLDYLHVYSARIIVEQHGATKTRIQIPLVQRAYNASTGVQGNVDTTTSTTYTQGNSSYYSLWRKNTSVFADLCTTSCSNNPWTLEAVLNGSSDSYTSYAALFNQTTNSQVTGAGVSVISITPTLLDTDFSNTAANFTEGQNFEARIKSSGITGQTAELRSAARLYVRLENLRKAEVYYRVARAFGASTGAKIADEQRVLLDKTKFSNPAIFYEATGYCADNAERLYLRDHGTNDYDTNGSNVTGSGLNFNSGTKAIKRSGDITANVTSGSRFYGQSAASSGSLEISHAWLVVQATEQIFHRWDGALKFFGRLTFF